MGLPIDAQIIGPIGNGAGATGGVNFSGTPSAGYVPIATGPTTAVWGPLTAPTNALLKAVDITKFSSIQRLGFAALGDSPPIYYNLSLSPCALNAGAGDNGLQVKPNSGTGCWIGNLPSPADIRIWGSVGDDATDNASSLSAALASGVPSLLVPSVGIFRSSGALSASAPVSIVGSYRPVGIYNHVCTNGLRFTAANINVITLNGAGSLFEGVCIDYTVTNSSGSGIVSPGGANSSKIASNQVNGACIGVDVSGNGSTQNEGTFVTKNTIILANNAACVGIRMGAGSSGGNTVNTKISQNELNCGNGNGIGLLVLDAGGILSTANVFGFDCLVGTKISPGANQQVLYSSFDGTVNGDSDALSDLIIDTGDSSAAILGNRFTGSWASNATSSPVVLSNTAGSLLVSGQDFSQQIVYVKPNQTGFNISGGTNTKIKGSTICSSGGANSTGLGISIGGNASNTTVQGNRIGDCDNTIGGTLPTGVSVTTSASNIGMVSDNNFTNTTTPLNWSPSATLSSIVFLLANNLGLDDVQPSVTTGTSVVIPPNTNVFLNGAGTVTSMTLAWQGRRMFLTSLSGAIAFGTGGNICNIASITQFQSIIATYNAALACWLLK